MIVYWSYLNKRKKTVDITIDGTFENIHDEVTDMMGPLSKLWVMTENADSKGQHYTSGKNGHSIRVATENCSVSRTM